MLFNLLLVNFFFEREIFFSPFLTSLVETVLPVRNNAILYIKMVNMIFSNFTYDCAGQRITGRINNQYID